jgi:hypothetical protein
MTDLSRPMVKMLWTVAQHKYGWTHVSGHGGQLQVAEALIRRGLARRSEIHVWRWQPIIVATDAGRAEIERRWPVSPFALGTYEHQPNGWDPVEGHTPPGAVVDPTTYESRRSDTCGGS